MQNPNLPGNISNEVKNNLKSNDSGDLIDFIKSNLKPVEQVPTPIQEAAKVGAESIVNTPSQNVEIKAPVETVEPTQELKVNEPPKEISSDVEELLELDGKESFKGLRQKVTRARNELAEKETLLKEKEAYIERVTKGEEEIEPIKVLKEENQKLAKYRDMYDLEISPEFISTRIAPLKADKDKLKAYAEEWSIPIETLEGLTEVDSERKINTFLSESFDAITGTEVKNLIGSIKAKQQAILQDKEAPKIALDNLRNDAVEAMRHQDEIRLNKIKSTATSSYNIVSKVLEDSGKYPELTRRGDPQHDHYVDLVKANIAKSYGETITELGNLGLKDLPESLANKIFAQVALSEITNLAAESRDYVYSEYTKVVGDARRRSNFESPPMGGFSRSGGGGGGSPERGPNSPAEAGDEILRRIGANR